MGVWLQRLASAERPPLWLDDFAYTARLLAGGEAPWLDIPKLIEWRRKAQGLLKGDIVALPVSPICAALLRADAKLRDEVSAKRRMTAPLRALLSAPAVRGHVIAALNGLRQSFSLPLALATPSPRRWVAEAYRLAHGEADVVDEEATDGASVYVADFLRAFGESGVAVLLFEEGPESAPASAFEIEWYRSAINVARHYGWDTGLHTPQALDAGGIVDFVIAPGSPTAVEIGAEFWRNGTASPVPAGAFRYATIPADEEPRRVLERLEMLRSAT